MSTYIGQRFGDYRLTRFLGKGSFGEVYLAEHVHEHTPAAVKLIQARLKDDSLKEFISEANTLFQLQHPNVVRLLGFGIGKDDTPFLATVYAPNGTLRQRYPKGARLSLEAVVSYVKPIALALQYAHDKRLIHRDVKPENILLGPNNEVWLSDFGITAIAHSTRSYDTEKPGGTIPYMAPEQLRGKPRPASDQYALGIMAYEWFCGERPFGGTATEIAMQHLIEPPSSLREKVPGISPEVEQVVLTALAKKPEERFGSVQAFAHALEVCRIVPSQPELPLTEIRPPSQPIPPAPPVVVNPPSQSVHPTPIEVDTPASPAAGRTETGISMPSPTVSPDTASSRTTPVAPSTRANVPPGVAVASSRFTRRKVVGLGLAGAGVIATGVVGWWELARRSPVVSVTPTPTPKPVGLLYTYHGHSSGVISVAWSPDGKRIASGSDDTFSVEHTVQVWDATNGGNVFIYHGHTDRVNAVAWSPDGKRIASGSDDHHVQVWDATNGGNVFTYHGHKASKVYAVAWSPDGKRIASAGDDVQVWDAMWNATSLGNVFTYHGHTDQVFTLAWSPDGKRIASGSGDNSVQVWDATNGGNVFTYHDHNSVVTSVAWSPDEKRIASGSTDNSVQVWDASSGHILLSYTRHSDRVNAVAWSPDGKRIASGSTDNSVLVWDATNGGNVFTYYGHSSSVYSVAWSPDGKFIASGGNDQTVQVWQPIL